MHGLLKGCMEGVNLSFSQSNRFPTDPNTWGIDTQFMWGGSLLISPVLTEVRRVQPLDSSLVPRPSPSFNFFLGS